MDTKTMINQLKYEAEKHKNDSLFTGQTNITALCNDVIPKLEKLAEYETAEEEGRLVVLPCKPWDKVYALFIVDVIDKKPIYKIFQAKVTKITIDRFRVLFSFKTLDENKYNSETTMEAFGETVFLTREEAEKALKEVNYPSSTPMD